MAESLIDVGIKLFQLGIILTILIIIYRRKTETSISSLWWFIAIFGLAAIQGLVELVIYFIKVEVIHLQNTSYFRFNEWHSIPYSLAILILYLLIEAMNNQRPHTLRFSIVFGSWVAYLTLLIFQTFNNYAIVFPDKPAAKQTYSIIFDLFQLIAMSFVSYGFYKAYENSNNSNNRRASFMVFLAVLVYVLGLGYELGESLLGFPDFYGAITFSITFLIMAYVYIKHPYFVFTVPSNVYRIMITTNGGVQLYSAEIAVGKNQSSDDLLAGGVSAMTSLMSEAVGSSEGLKSIVLGDRVLTVRNVKGLLAFIIADNSTYILNSALDQFIAEFEIKFRNEIDNFKADVSGFREGKEIIARCFPFVEADDIIETRNNQQRRGAIPT